MKLAAMRGVRASASRPQPRRAVAPRSGASWCRARAEPVAMAERRRGLHPAAARADADTDTVTDNSIFDEMKQAAMKLHTKDQSASGGQEAKKRPEFVPTKEGYLRYLMDSREVFSTLEDIVKESDTLGALRDNGLERTSALDKDIAFLESEGWEPVGFEGDASPGAEYAAFLRKMSEENLPGFLCHYYNTYFAHTAGGRMIGKAVSNKILDGKKLDFYHDYPKGAVSKLTTPVKDSIEEIANTWSEGERSQCVNQTPNAFKYAGMVMRQITATK